MHNSATGVRALKAVALLRASHTGEIALAGSRHLRSTLVVMPAFSRTLLSQLPKPVVFSPLARIQTLVQQPTPHTLRTSKLQTKLSSDILTFQSGLSLYLYDLDSLSFENSPTDMVEDDCRASNGGRAGGEGDA
jgi:hypothetical protein